MAAEAVVDLVFEWFIALEVAVSQERTRLAGRPVPIPILGLWAVDFAVTVLHALGCYPNLPLRHVLPFAACISTALPAAAVAARPGAPVPIGSVSAADGHVLPLGELLAAAAAATAGGELATVSRLGRYVERMAGLVAGGCGEEFGSSFRALPTVASAPADGPS